MKTRLTNYSADRRTRVTALIRKPIGPAQLPIGISTVGMMHHQKEKGISRRITRRSFSLEKIKVVIHTSQREVFSPPAYAQPPHRNQDGRNNASPRDDAI